MPEKNQLLHILQQGFEFFRHVATAHASKLLDQARLRRFRKGDAIIKQGETANHVYIIINGMAVQYVSEAETIDAEVWQMWELHRFQSDFARLGDRVKTVYVGRSIGEQEVPAPFISYVSCPRLMSLLLQTGRRTNGLQVDDPRRR